ncbi:hypothetical protein ACFPIJ_25910 [Dactylosporangium cerinum]|uniref:Uncharacterized protein n=1 Tax=Dactylosporangium cerinum TaxID=1434730 RepID=A0ABV9VXY2_9ACTN
MGDLYYFVPQAAFALPSIATLIVGVALLWARRKRLAHRAWTLGLAGLAVLLAGAVADLVYMALLPRVIRYGDWQESRALLAGASLGFLVLHVLGMALLIAGLLATARPDDPWPAPAAIDPPAGPA